MSSSDFEELLGAEIDCICQHLRGLERRLIEEYRRALGGLVASSLVGTTSAASQAWGCQLTIQKQPDDVDSSIGVPKVEDHKVQDPVVCASLDFDRPGHQGLDSRFEVRSYDCEDEEYCSSCGKDFMANANFCGKCGAKRVSDEVPITSRHAMPELHTMAWPPDHEPPVLLRQGKRGSGVVGTPAKSRSPRASRQGTPAASARPSLRLESEDTARRRSGSLQSDCLLERSTSRGSIKRRSGLNPADLNRRNGSSSLTSADLNKPRLSSSSVSGPSKGQISNIAAMRRARAAGVPDRSEDEELAEDEEDMVQRQRSKQSGLTDDGEGLTGESSSHICTQSRTPSPGTESAGRKESQSRRSSFSERDSSNGICHVLSEFKPDKHDFNLLEAWTDPTNRPASFGMMAGERSRLRSTRAQSQVRKSICQTEGGGLFEGYGDKPAWYKCVESIMLSPSSYKHLCWDFTAGLLIVFDICIVPLQLLDPPSVKALTVLSFVVRLFWTADFLLCFLTGYVDHKGETQTSPRAVARRYASTWMLPDFTLVVCDWAEVVAKETITYGGTDHALVGRIVSGVRLLRVVRLVRLTKAREVTEFIIEHVQSENIILISDILKIVAVMLALTHLIACAWYGLGKHGESRERSWVKYRYLEEMTLLERYIWSFHCAIAFWTGEHIVQPRSTLERAFLASMMVVTFMLSVWFVSCMTTAMTRLQIIAGQNSVQFSALSRYLTSNQISQELRNKVLRNAQFAVEQRKRNADESCIELLPVVSEPLRMELRFEVCSPILYIHPFFRHLGGVNTAGIRKVCHVTLSWLDFSRGDVVFTEEGAVGEKMFFVINGILLYTQERTRQRKVTRKNWLSEMVLWTVWSHRGTLHSANECHLLALDAKTFIGVVSKFPGSQVFEYGKKFVNRLRKMEAFELSDIGQEDEAISKIASRAFEQEDAVFEKRESLASRIGGGRSLLKRAPSATFRRSQSALGTMSSPLRAVKFSFRTVMPTHTSTKRDVKMSEGVEDRTQVKFSIEEEPAQASEDS